MFDLPHNFGDYTLVAFIGRTRGGILYQAIQQGMDRSVFLELLDPDNPEGVGVEDFLMKARTRAVPVRSAWVTIQSSPLNSATGSGTALVTPASLSPR